MKNTEDLGFAYSVFKAKPLHLLRLGPSNKLKECTAAYYSSTETFIDVLYLRQLKGKIVRQMTITYGCSNLSAAYERSLPGTDMQIDFFTSQ